MFMHKRHAKEAMIKHQAMVDRKQMIDNSPNKTKKSTTQGDSPKRVISLEGLSELTKSMASINKQNPFLNSLSRNGAVGVKSDKQQSLEFELVKALSPKSIVGPLRMKHTFCDTLEA
jgi:hypothetical protein